MEDVALTITEAAAILHPPVAEYQLRLLIRALRIQPAGARHDGGIGRPQATYDAADLMRLHAALTPWLDSGYTEWLY